MSLNFELIDQSFTERLTGPPSINSDVIKTDFTAAPGDVIVLAGLFEQKDRTITSGPPGTTGKLGVASPLFGGSDQVNAESEEMLILMVPSVIEPRAGNRQVNSAYPN